MNLSEELWRETKMFYLKMFTVIDEDVNGYLSDREFKKFLITCDIQMTQDEFNSVYDCCNDPSRGALQGKFLFEDFVNFMEDLKKKYVEKNLPSPVPKSPVEVEFEKLFEEIDTDHSGSISFREIMIFCKKKGLRLGFGEIVAFVKFYDTDGDGELILDEVKSMINNDSQGCVPGMAFVPEAPVLCEVLSCFGPGKSKSNQEALKNVRDVQNSLLSILKPKFEDEFDSGDVENMRWSSFASFNRQVGNESVMTGGKNIVQDILPGKYNLQDMVNFDDLPDLKPRFVEIKNISWVSGSGRQPGMLIFPDNFDGFLDVEFATNELLNYYGCSIANTRKDDTVIVDMRHAIQDFTYVENYLQKFVLAPTALHGNGGAGLERHDFHHLDCPLDVDNGFFILAKFLDDDENESTLHITAFRIPVRHTLYLPGGVIHCNDYLKGTWRTMLSDAAPIDYVHLNREGENFHFKFKKCH